MENMSSIQMVLALAAQHSPDINQLDVQSAFLNGTLAEEHWFC